METEDTGWTYTLTCKGCNKPYEIINAFPEHQYCDDCLIIFRDGMKQVVDFVEDEGVMYQYTDTLNRWQAKLKEWGIE